MKRIPALFFIQWLALVVFLARVGFAQETNPEPTEQNQEAQEPSRSRASQNLAAGPQSFSDMVFTNPRNERGFSVAAYGIYSSNIVNANLNQISGMVTSLFPSGFLNFGRRKTRAHLDYGIGYRFYTASQAQSSAQHSGGFTLTHQMSRRASFTIADRFSIQPNDSSLSTFSRPGSGSIQASGFSSDVLLNFQKVARNSLSGQLDLQLFRKGRIGVTGGYDVTRYQVSTDYNAAPVSLGIRYDHELTKRVTVVGGYSTYLNNRSTYTGVVDTRFRDTKIHRLDGGVRFRVERNWIADMTVGDEIANVEGTNESIMSFRGGLSHMGRTNSVSASYQKGFTQAIGAARLLASHTVNLFMAQKIGRRVVIQASSYYLHGAGFLRSAPLEIFAAAGGLEYSIRPDLIATVNYVYQKQRTLNLAVDPMAVNRYIISSGLQYLFPEHR